MLKEKYKQFFKTLGNDQRVEIIFCLLEGKKSVAEIMEAIQGEQSSVSHNLKRLETCAFVSVIPRGKQRIYSVNQETVLPLFHLIKEHAKKYCQHLCCS